MAIWCYCLSLQAKKCCVWSRIRIYSLHVFIVLSLRIHVPKVVNALFGQDVKVYPLHVWNAKFFSTLANLFWRFISLNEYTLKKQRLDVGSHQFMWSWFHWASYNNDVNGEVHEVSFREEPCDKMLVNWFSKNKVFDRKSLSPQAEHLWQFW